MEATLIRSEGKRENESFNQLNEYFQKKLLFSEAVVGTFPCLIQSLHVS